VDLRFTEEEDAFRHECRQWLEADILRGYKSGDAREGFAQL